MIDLKTEKSFKSVLRSRNMNDIKYRVADTGSLVISGPVL